MRNVSLVIVIRGTKMIVLMKSSVVVGINTGLNGYSSFRLAEKDGLRLPVL